MQSIAFDAGSPPASVGWMYAAVSGQPGKLKLKGLPTGYDVTPGFPLLRVRKLSGKQITP